MKRSVLLKYPKVRSIKYLVTLLCVPIGLLSCREDSISQSPPLIGKWQFIGFADGQGQLVEPEPNSQVKPLSITITADSIQGDLDVNNMSALYRLPDNVTPLIIVNSFIYTEALGTPREQKFLENFPRDTARYTLQADTLMLFPASSNNRASDTDNTPTVYQRAE